MRSGEEIQAALRAFAQRWRDYTGTERAEAQTFLNQLLECYGVDRQATGIEFEKRTSDLGFMDLYWPQWCIVEMKAPSRAERLSTHYQQVRDYWEASADDVAGTPAARFVVLCAFHRFEIWEPGRFPRSPRVIVDLQDLPDRYDASGQGSCCGICGTQDRPHHAVQRRGRRRMDRSCRTAPRARRGRRAATAGPSPSRRTTPSWSAGCPPSTPRSPPAGPYEPFGD